MKRSCLRYIYLYSPAVVVAAAAVVFTTYDRNDFTVVAACVLLAITLVFHTCQIVRDFHKTRNGSHRGRHP